MCWAKFRILCCLKDAVQVLKRRGSSFGRLNVYVVVYYVKLVLVYLLQSRQSFTAEQINEACGVDVKGNMPLFRYLAGRRNAKYDGKHFSYQCKYDDVRDKTQLVKLIRRNVEGVRVDHLKDSYPTAMNDIQALKDSGQIWLLLNTDLQQEIAYPRNDLSIRVDDELKTLFGSIDLPSDMSRILGAKSAKRRMNGNDILNKPELKKMKKISSWKLLIK
ncbi:uncharacterized protein LOC143586220 [Bidens hawaiensis]|uniref:uncharacterized protein LOC143586220 n=1 Tax=Bidens hawaiensis TaxID=980011 RepID=UPI00404B1BF6